LVLAPAGREVLEGLVGLGENGGGAGCRLIASDNNIDIERIELDATAHPIGFIGGDEGGFPPMTAGPHRIAKNPRKIAVAPPPRAEGPVVSTLKKIK